MPPPAPAPPRRTPDPWVYLAFALAAVQAALRLAPESRPGLAGAYCWEAGRDLLPPAAAVAAAVGVAVALSERSLRWPWRPAGFLALAAAVGSAWTFRAYPSSHDGRPSAVAFRLPLDGPVVVASGGAAAAANGHAAEPARRWAFDLTVTRGGRTHSGDGTAVSDYYAYGLPVIAPADGVVVETRDDEPDEPPGRAGKTTDGNFIVLEVAPGEFLWLGHLRPGSITVTSGDQVARGQSIARVGNSGDTLGRVPLLHVHLQDSNDHDFSEAVPLEFHHYKVGGRLVERGTPAGGGWSPRTPAGPVVENVEVETAPPPQRPPTPSRRGD